MEDFKIEETFLCKKFPLLIKKIGFSKKSIYLFSALPRNFMDNTYKQLIGSLKDHIRLSQQQAVLSVNTRLLFLYWEVGQFILRQQQQRGWGTEVVKQVSADLSSEFPDMKGFSIRNLSYMVQFAKYYPTTLVQPPNKQIMQPPVAQIEQPVSWMDFAQLSIAKITWSHHIILMDKTHTPEARNYYLQRTIEEGWSKRVLQHKIEQKLFESQGSFPNNFDRTLPPVQSELAKQTLKDTYIFDFLSLGDQAREREIENALLKQITLFLLEMGKGFAFMGQQYRLKVGQQDYYFDLLFYHTRLNCYFIIELKIDDFKPEYTGKLNFYLNIADDILKQGHQNPTIGLLLCKSADKVVAEYSLKDNQKPMGVATYQLLPKKESFINLLNTTPK